MPTYEFKCPECGADVMLNIRIRELEQEGNTVVCPNPRCGVLMKRTYTAPGIIFKGDGWASKSNEK